MGTPRYHPQNRALGAFHPRRPRRVQRVVRLCWKTKTKTPRRGDQKRDQKRAFAQKMDYCCNVFLEHQLLCVRNSTSLCVPVHAPAPGVLCLYFPPFGASAIDPDLLASSHALTAARPTATNAPRRRSASRSAAASASAAGTSATPSRASRPPSASSSALTAGADSRARTACRRRDARDAASTTRGSGAALDPGGAPGTVRETNASLPRCPRFVYRLLSALFLFHAFS